MLEDLDADDRDGTERGLRIPPYDLAALAGTAIILLMMGWPWIMATLYTGDQGLVQIALLVTTPPGFVPLT